MGWNGMPWHFNDLYCTSLTDSLIDSLTHLPRHSLTHSPVHSLIYSLTYFQPSGYGGGGAILNLRTMKNVCENIWFSNPTPDIDPEFAATI